MLLWATGRTGAYNMLPLSRVSPAERPMGVALLLSSSSTRTTDCKWTLTSTPGLAISLPLRRPCTKRARGILGEALQLLRRSCIVTLTSLHGFRWTADLMKSRARSQRWRGCMDSSPTVCRVLGSPSRRSVLGGGGQRLNSWRRTDYREPFRLQYFWGQFVKKVCYLALANSWGEVGGRQLPPPPSDATGWHSTFPALLPPT